MHRSEGFTLIELMITVAIIAILIVIAIPSLQNARKSANETSAIGFLKMSSGVNIRYRTRFGAYPGDENDLLAAGLLDASHSPSGYLLNYTSSASTDTWTLQADPELPGRSGDRYFLVDHSGVIRFSLSGTATTSDEPLGER